MKRESHVRYLDPQTLAQVGSLELRARMIVEGMMTGMHRSPYFGFSVEFAQHRPYAPGDDLRHLDWKVFARTDKLYLKQYQKETNLDLQILVDISGSMRFGSAQRSNWCKYDHAASLAATIAYLALKQQDRVGLVLFGDRVWSTQGASNASDHWRSIIKALGTAQEAANEGTGHGSGEHPERGTNLGQVLDQVVAKLARRSLVVVVSDLFDDTEGLERGLARLHHQRHDLIVLQVLDPAELSFPYRAPLEFFGLEGEGRLRLDPAALCKAYLEGIRTHLDNVEQLTRRFGFHHLIVDSSQSLGPPLSRFLDERAAAVSKARRVRR